MTSVLPHPESLFISASERAQNTADPAEAKPAPSVGDKIKRLKQKRELAQDLQQMIANSGLSIEELREALARQSD
jgi:hypothetical protein